MRSSSTCPASSPSLAGPRRPQDRVPLRAAQEFFRRALSDFVALEDGEAPQPPEPDARELCEEALDETIEESYPASDPPANGTPCSGGSTGASRDAPRAAPRAPRPRRAPSAPAPAGAASATSARPSTAVSVTLDGGESFELDHGHVVIAAITSCTNTSNPSVMVGAGVLARNARERGLRSKPWVKTSLAPGSKVVTEYLDRAGLTAPLEELGFNLVGYGCTTCIGNSGPLAQEISAAVADADLAVVSVLSGNRNFEGRINPDVKMNYLASPPLCVAYALAGTMDIDIAAEPLGQDADGQDVYLRDIWPSEQEVAATVGECVRAEMFRDSYGEVFTGDERWRTLPVPAGERFGWEEQLDVRAPAAVFRRHAARSRRRSPTSTGRACWRCSATASRPTTSRRRARSSATSPAGRYLQEHGVEPRDFNSYGARRGNHEVMVRGTFANIRLRNLLGGGEPLLKAATRATSRGRRAEQMTIYDAAMRYRPRAPSSSCSPARSTAPAPRATGPPRARCCSACAR